MSRHLSKPTAIEWTFLAIGLWLVFRYMWILDDAFVYYRYVDNLLFLHRGFVYNQGEYAEGFSSPLWALLLIPLRATKLDFWTITKLVAGSSFVLFWYGTVVVNRRLSSSERVVNLPLVYLGTCYGVLEYFSSGSETPLVQLSALAVALFVLSPRSLLLQLCLGLVPLARNELIIPIGVAIVAGYAMTRKVPWALAISTTVCFAAWLVFRVYYYADFFPTTFYLKDHVDAWQGLAYLRNTVNPYSWAGILIVAAVMWLSTREESAEKHRLSPRAAMLLIAGSSLVYVVRIGGDMMHYRFLAFPFCLSVLALGGICEDWLDRFSLLKSPLRRGAFAIALGAVLFANYPSFLTGHPAFGEVGRELDHGISDAPWHRYHPEIRFNGKRGDEDKTRLARYEKEQGQAYARVATDVACVTMYDHPEIRYVHGYGLTDPILARVAVPENRPGHKEALRRLATDLVRLRSRFTDTRAGMLDRAIHDRAAAPWLIQNADAIRAIEKRLYNRHHFIENLMAAFQRIPRLHV